MYDYKDRGSFGRSVESFICGCNKEVMYQRTVVPAKSDSDVMLCLQSYQDLESIDHLCINPIRK